MRGYLATAGVCLVVLFAGCSRQEMADQARYDTFEPDPHFADGRSARPLVEGVVPRGHLRDDVLLYTGKQTASDANFADTFPFEITEPVLRRGQERFNIFCGVCHGHTGHANGIIVERGYLRPPNFHTEPSRGYPPNDPKVSLREVPVGYLFDVITNGYGAMPDYRSELKPQDRWAVVAYLRALQRSQNVPLSELSAEERAKLPARKARKANE